MEKLVELSEQEVRIDFTLNCKCRANVRLRSLTATTPIAFKVQTSSPEKFMVNPPTGLISPLSYATFQVILKPQNHFPTTYPRSPSDNFLVKTSRFFPDSSDSTRPFSITSWFLSIPNCSTEDYKLKVVFVGPMLLHHAVSRGDCGSAKNLIKKQKSIMAELSQRESEALIRVATELANPESMVNLLLEAGLKIEARVQLDNVNYKVDSERISKGWEKLHVAAAFDRTEEVLEFVKMKKARSLDCRDNDGRTPLHVAVGKGNIKCARVLVELGADKDARSRDGRTALHRAAVNGDRRMVEMLIEMGADPTIANDRGCTPLDIARDKGHKKVSEILERGDLVITAARKGDLENLQWLLQKGATIKHRDEYGFTALHAAAIEGHKDVVQKLIESGSDFESQDREGHTPLHLAVVAGSLETVEVLVNEGADINVNTKFRATPLHMATILGYDDIAEFLISRGGFSSL
ncbi:protein VAPYRIN-like [Ziziphus jujuba]|uniref:Protein VAPYRIN-like n=1 Tax=Ziziphus jujuba TaxID=326968 RepID=A0A6P3ZGZ2_ZIZJJ|nr:protein VAPYRIN-like [Ziziphus jujuba]